MTVRRALLIVAVSAVIPLCGCRPPESERTRGGGQGADLGNRGSSLTIHERKDPFEGTPRRGRAVDRRSEKPAAEAGDR